MALVFNFCLVTFVFYLHFYSDCAGNKILELR
jgi:hypothetical protein